jgi:hypothetical protein
MSKRRLQATSILILGGMVIGFATGIVISATEPSAATDDAQLADEAIKRLRQRSPESYIDTAAIWPAARWPIPACWEASASAYPTEKRWVESTIDALIEDVSSVKFSRVQGAAFRWPDCSAASLGIRIAVADATPRSDVGYQWRAAAGGGRIEMPTRMTLNFVLGEGFSPYCDERRQHCVQVTAVHEMLHAIGFLHEHLRRDAPPDCKKRFEHLPDVQGNRPEQWSTAYDADSIMNYCESIYRTPVRLSEEDVQAIEAFYRLQ